MWRAESLRQAIYDIGGARVAMEMISAHGASSSGVAEWACLLLMNLALKGTPSLAIRFVLL